MMANLSRQTTDHGLLLKGTALAAWISLSLILWSAVVEAMLFDRATGGGSEAAPDFTLSLVQAAGIALLFLGWLAGSWALFRKVNADARTIQFAFFLALPAILAVIS